VKTILTSSLLPHHGKLITQKQQLLTHCHSSGSLFGCGGDTKPCPAHGDWPL